MSVTCPNGHTSESEDYCDVCGSPIDASTQSSSGRVTPAPYAAGPAPAAAPRAAPAGSGGSSLDLGVGPASEAGAGAPAGEAAAGEAGAAESLECPNCQAPNPPGALFCEACGYDFTTGAMPRVAVATAPSAQSTDGGAPTSSSVQDVPAPAASSSPTPASSVQDLPAPAASSSPTPSSSVQDVPSEQGFEWLAEVWVDPDWYQTQEAEDPCPSPGLPIIIPLRSRSVLLGRVSQSRNTHPEIDLSSDPGVSRRHAQLTTDGARWFVEDLGSSNGTFVGRAAGPLPDDPIAVGPRTELGDDDRLYVGAWTRVVVRRATPDEAQVYA